jgi:hypothetical protein
VDHNDARHDADTGHDTNANVMRMLEREREGRADFNKSKDILIKGNVSNNTHLIHVVLSGPSQLVVHSKNLTNYHQRVQ